MAQTGLLILGRHTWYLQQQIVPMALFSDKMSDDMKSRLAAKVLTYETERELMVDIALEKPNLKLSIIPATTIYDLVGPRSFLMWDILGIGYDWLRKGIEHWESSQDYLEMRDYVRSVKVTNDAAERGVKVYFSWNFFVLLRTTYVLFLFMSNSK